MIRRLMLSVAGAVLCLPALGQEGPLQDVPPKGHTPQEIIQIVAQKEVAFKRARENYVYRQDEHVQEYDGHTAVGEYRMVEDVTFDDRGKRQENVVLAPENTLRNVSLTRQDETDFRSIFSFVITPDLIPVYDIKYLGMQKEDELNTYVFDLNPVKLEKNKRYFKGRIWVDDQDLLIVKTSGIGVPNGKDNQPVPFTTWREQVDGKYWFPTYTSGEANICAQDKHGVCMDSGTPIKVSVKYTDYKQYKATSTITFGGEVDDTQQNQAPPPTAPNPK